MRTRAVGLTPARRLGALASERFVPSIIVIVVIVIAVVIIVIIQIIVIAI